MADLLDRLARRPTDDSAQFSAQTAAIEAELGQQQRALRVANVPVIIVFEGWEASGKGTVINRLALSLDPRGYRVYTVQPGSPDDLYRPPLYRFWRDLPEPGRIALYDRSWYDHVWRALAEGDLRKRQLAGACEDICAFERTLVDQGYLLIKLFLHIDKTEQGRRFRKLQRDPATTWRIDASDERQQRRHKTWRNAIEQVMAATSRTGTPFVVIDAKNRHAAALTAFREIRNCLLARLSPQAVPTSGELHADPPAPEPNVWLAGSAAPECVAPSESLDGVSARDPSNTRETNESPVAEAAPESVAPSESLDGVPAPSDTEAHDATAAAFQHGTIGSNSQPPHAAATDAAVPAPTGRITTGASILASVDLTQHLDPTSYATRLHELHSALSELQSRIYEKRVGVVILYEGWDAAGKGGNIRRLASALDPRGYEVVPIGAPTGVEHDMHYLWRFAKRLPKMGHITVFDRTWYGRVLVERVEGFCPAQSWKLAYDEIRAFETHLARSGYAVVKFWLHIDPEEQLRRFRAREETPDKRWKITDEDWRNREKWPLYAAAVDDMLELTSTKKCPWTVVAANDKLHARIFALETVASAIAKRL